MISAPSEDSFDVATEIIDELRRDEGINKAWMALSERERDSCFLRVAAIIETQVPLA